MKKILVVDDEADVLASLSNILRRANYDVSLAATGKEAVELARSIKPDLIILDVLLPDMDGGEVASVLSEDAATKDIPITFLTGIIKQDEKYNLTRTGKRYIVAKPVMVKELLAVIDQALSREPVTKI